MIWLLALFLLRGIPLAKLSILQFIVCLDVRQEYVSIRRALLLSIEFLYDDYIVILINIEIDEYFNQIFFNCFQRV